MKKLIIADVAMGSDFDFSFFSFSFPPSPSGSILYIYILPCRFSMKNTVVTMNVLIAFLIDAYQAHVASIARRVKRWDNTRRRYLHSQTSLPDDLRRSRTMSVNNNSTAGNNDNGAPNERRHSLHYQESAWQTRLHGAAQSLGYDLSQFHIRKEKGVGDFYQDLYKDN
jgi:hypothetical protein